mgnify:CR=1 FL=1
MVNAGRGMPVTLMAASTPLAEILGEKFVKAYLALKETEYEAFFRFKQRPFSLTPDPKFYFRSRSHGRVFDALSAAVSRRESVMLIAGDLGVGKTTLCRTLIETQERKARAIYAQHNSLMGR